MKKLHIYRSFGTPTNCTPIKNDNQQTGRQSHRPTVLEVTHSLSLTHSLFLPEAEVEDDAHNSPHNDDARQYVTEEHQSQERVPQLCEWRAIPRYSIGPHTRITLVVDVGEYELPHLSPTLSSSPLSHFSSTHTLLFNDGGNWNVLQTTIYTYKEAHFQFDSYICAQL